MQKCHEYFYIGSKTTSSTTVLPASPKRLKAEHEKSNANETPENQLFQCSANLAEENTEYCATPKQQENTDSILINEFNNNTNKINLKNNQDNQNISSDNNNYNSNFNSNNDYNNKKTLITKENFTQSLNKMLQTNEYAKGKGNCALKSNCASNNPNFNYGKFHEEQKLIHVNSVNSANSVNSLDSASTNLMTASTAESPLPLNSCGNLDINQNCYNNLNLIFSEDYFHQQRNSYRNNCK